MIAQKKIRSVSSELLSSLQRNPANIRHICILAHVDHGKTTLADSLLASNGVISQKMAGKLRYMDSRKDEQERGITMKSSSVAIHFKKAEEDYLINVIDSPGHVDFAGEVCTAVRLCDGAIVLVDVVEGVCPQTKVALQQAWIEHIKPLLVLNKIDRLILEWKLTPLDAYAHLVQILEQVNAVMGELFASDIFKKSDNKPEDNQNYECINDQVFDWSSGLDDSDDSKVYFSPEQGNVVFASALDGWGFGISQFASIYAAKLGAHEKSLLKTLWGDFYLNFKTKKILKGASAKAKKPLFVQFILENIWSVYEAIMVNRDNSTVEKIVKSLNLSISPRETNHKDPKICLHALFGQWLPLSTAVLEMVCNFVPNPLQLSEEKVEGLMCSSALKFDVLPEKTRNLKKDFLQCSSSDNAPVIVCISKMFPTEKNMLPENRHRPLTAEEIAERRERAKQRLIEKTESLTLNDDNTSASKPEIAQESSTEQSMDSDDGTTFIAFARVYSGCVRPGTKVYVLGPKHDPSKALNMETPLSESITVHDLHPEQHMTLTTVKSLYLLMGKELIALDHAPAGNVVGIGGLQDHVLKSATLSSTVACPSFIDLHASTVPIVRVALEPVNPRDMPSLVKGMRLLNQADPCVQVFVQETGEHVLVTAGEVHLQRCVDDLKERFAKIDINVSPPIVPFRETIIIPPKTDMVNEAIEEKSATKKSLKTDCDSSACKKDENPSYIKLKTPNKLSQIQMHAIPLPPEATKLLEENADLLKAQDQAFYSCGENEDILTPETSKSLDKLKTDLDKIFLESGPEWADATDKIWSFGPRRCGPNVLLNRTSHYKRPSLWTSNSRKLDDSEDTVHSNYDSTFISGFQLATLCGPLCDEPMMGVCFVVDDWTFESEAEHKTEIDVPTKEQKPELDIPETDSVCSSSQSSTPFGPFTGQIMSTVKEACKKAFQAQPQRLMSAMYSCSIQVAMDMLGKMYAVLGRRHGRILHADMQEGSQIFHVTAELPVIESFDFANEIRKQTSGKALPQLIFSHWEVVDVDPFWSPRTEEEYAHFGEKADVENRALKYMNNVRRRKGLAVDEKIVEHAEKQRTMKKNK